MYIDWANIHKKYRFPLAFKIIKQKKEPQINRNSNFTLHSKINSGKCTAKNYSNAFAC